MTIGIVWNSQGECMLAEHERHAIEANLDEPGHHFADDERGPRRTCAAGELGTTDAGELVIVTRDGYTRIIGNVVDTANPGGGAELPELEGANAVAWDEIQREGIRPGTRDADAIVAKFGADDRKIAELSAKVDALADLMARVVARFPEDVPRDLGTVPHATEAPPAPEITVTDPPKEG
jgi:hypothetical protein